MIGVVIFILSLVVLYLLATVFIQKLFIILFRLTRSREKAANLLGWIFLPGTFIHEISHFLTALLLFVPVRELRLMPETEEHGIKLGSVMVGKTDFVRASIIGLAPLIAGVSIILWGLSFSVTHNYLGNPWVIVLLIYSGFQITHTMFSSKKDLVAVLELVVFIVVLSIALFLLKIDGPFIYIYKNLNVAGPTIQRLSYFLFIPIGLELVFLTIFRKVRI